MSSTRAGDDHQDLFVGLVRLHILFHAAKHEVYGLWVIEELGRHGYRLSPGTVYPLLRSMERKGYLTSRELRDGRSGRRAYRATEAGLAALVVAKEKIRELCDEVGDRDG